MEKINKGALLQLQAFASQLVPAAVGFVSFMVLLRYAPAEAVGQFLMYMAAVVLFEMIKSGGMQSALVMRLSGAIRHQQQVVVGSAYFLGGILAVGISLVLGGLYFSGWFQGQPGLQVFCGWYAVLGLVTLPLHVAEATAVAEQDIRFLLWLRIGQSITNLCISIYAWALGGTLESLATIHLAVNGALLVLVLALRKTNPLLVVKKTAAEVKVQLGLVRYTLATLAATNALKSADTFLIGSMLGPRAVAAYAVPLKLTELFEIPLRSLSSTAFPQLAACNNNNDHTGFRSLFTRYLSGVYLLYLPALLLALVLAPLLVTVMGGAQYAYTATVFQVLVCYGLLLPADRLSGIGLDALQQPKHNLLKVLLMATVNILADVLALKLSGRLEWVAFASVLNAATGAWFGLWLMNRQGAVATRRLLPDALLFAKTTVQKLKPAGRT